MASLYWVGGNNTWDTGVFWATSSGGVASVGVTTAADDLFFDGNSGAAVVAIATSRVGKTLNCTGFTGTLNKSWSTTLRPTISGSITLAAGMTLGAGMEFNMNAAGTFTSNGKTLPGLLNANAGGSNVVQFGDNVVFGGALVLTSGVLTTNSHTVSATVLDVSTNVGTINCGTSVITLTATDPLATFASAGTVTLNASTATLRLTHASPVRAEASATKTVGTITLTACTGDFDVHNFVISSFITSGSTLNTYSQSSGSPGGANVTLGSDLVVAGSFFLGTGTNASTFSGNGFNVTADSVSLTGTAGKTFTMGNGTWTLTGTATVWALGTVTFNASSSTIKINDASSFQKTFAGGGRTYNNIWLTGAGTGTFNFTGSNTFNDFKCDTPPHDIKFTAGTTTTVATFTVSGTAGNLIIIGSITAASHALAKSGGGTIRRSFLSVSRSDASPGTTWFTDQSTDGGNNTGWIFATVFNDDLTNALAAAETVTGAAVDVGALTEAGSAADSTTGSVIVSAAVAVAETGAAADTVAASRVLVNVLTEAGAASDAVTISTGSYGVAVVESGAAADALIGSITSALTETAAFSDSVTLLGTQWAGWVTEGMTLIDVQAAYRRSNETVAETGAAVDVLVGGFILRPVLVEALNGTDGVNGTRQTPGTMADIISFADAPNATASFHLNLTQGMTLSDVIAAGELGITVLTEAGSVVDVVVGNRVFSKAIAEVGSLADVITRSSLSVGVLNEYETPFDTLSSQSIVRPTLSESLILGDAVTGVRIVSGYGIVELSDHANFTVETTVSSNTRTIT